MNIPSTAVRAISTSSIAVERKSYSFIKTKNSQPANNIQPEERIICKIDTNKKWAHFISVSKLELKNILEDLQCNYQQVCRFS